MGFLLTYSKESWAHPSTSIPKLIERVSTTFLTSSVNCPNSPPPSGRFMGPDRSRILRLFMASSKVVVSHPMDAGRERNGGEKDRQLRSDFSILSTSADETSANSFVLVRGVRLWSQLVDSLTEEGESKKRNFCNSDGFSSIPATPSLPGHQAAATAAAFILLCSPSPNCCVHPATLTAAIHQAADTPHRSTLN